MKITALIAALSLVGFMAQAEHHEKKEEGAAPAAAEHGKKMEKKKKAISVQVSAIILNWAALITVWPILLAGTCKTYSKKAIAQEIKMTSHKDFSANFKCPYQATTITEELVNNINIESK